jgi:hypothetical protein
VTAAIAHGGAWDPLTPAQLAVLLAAFDGPWWVAGGHAIDMFVGDATRDHDDLDVAVFRDHWPSVAGALSGWDFREGTNETWARRDADGPWLVEFLLEERSGADWVYRRNSEVTSPVTQLGMVTAEGIPFERPEVVLLYKAKYHDMPKHDADLAAALPKLGIGPRCWLAGALDVAHPGHPWIERLL